jgi:hypothetical protein
MAEAQAKPGLGDGVQNQAAGAGYSESFVGCPESSPTTSPVAELTK